MDAFNSPQQAQLGAPWPEGELSAERIARGLADLNKRVANILYHSEISSSYGGAYRRDADPTGVGELGALIRIQEEEGLTPVGLGILIRRVRAHEMKLAELDDLRTSIDRLLKVTNVVTQSLSLFSDYIRMNEKQRQTEASPES